MREVIDEILGSEKEAQRIVEEARAAATETRNRAEVETVRILASARDDAQAILREQMEKAREEARVAHEARVRKAEEESRLFLERHEGSIRKLVDDVAKLILTPEHSRGSPLGSRLTALDGDRGSPLGSRLTALDGDQRQDGDQG